LDPEPKAIHSSVSDQIFLAPEINALVDEKE